MLTHTSMGSYIVYNCAERVNFELGARQLILYLLQFSSLS